MTEPTGDSKKGVPTEKMIDSAKKAAERQAIALPENFDKDFDVCKAFLDAHLSKPTPKALAFAEKIAKEHDIPIPEDARASGKALSAWIDEHK